MIKILLSTQVLNSPSRIKILLVVVVGSSYSCGYLQFIFPGYGVLHPTTWYSKVACCLYAMAGLPLYIIMLGAAGFINYLKS